MRTSPERKKSLILIFLLIAAVVSGSALRAAGEPQKKGLGIEFKLSGAIGFPLNGGGDLETYRQGMVDFYGDIGTLVGFTGNASWKKMRSVPGFEFDVILRLNERFGVGIGTGYLKASSRGNYGFVYGQAGSESWGTYALSGTATNGEDFSISAVPIRLSLYLTFPTGRWNFYGTAGAGLYLGTFARRYSYDFTYDYADSSPIYLDEKQEITSSESWDESAKKNSFGFHGGLGVDYKVSSYMSFGLEVFGRLVNFSGWEGDSQWTTSSRERDWREDAGWHTDQSSTDSGSLRGKVWYYEIQDQDLGIYSPQINMWGAPSGGAYRNARNAAINLNAFGLAVTLKVYFDF